MEITILLYTFVIVTTLCLSRFFLPSQNKRVFAVFDLLKGISRGLIISYPLFVLLASRYNIGTDYVNYESLYDYYCKTGISTFEPLFTFLLYLGDLGGWNFDNIIVITSFICVYIPLCFIENIFNRDEAVSAILIFIVLFFGSWFNIIRQCMAVSFLLISIYYLLKRNAVCFIVCVILGSLFHSSSLIFLPCVFFLRITRQNLDSKQFAKKIILLFLASLILIIVYLLYGFDIMYYSHVNGEAGDGITSKWFIIFSVFFYVIEFRNYRNILLRDKNYSVLYLLVVLEFMCYILGLYMNLGYRMGQLFSLAHVFLLPRCLTYTSNKSSVKLYLYSILIVFFIFTTFISKYNAVYDYLYKKDVLQSILFLN